MNIFVCMSEIYVILIYIYIFMYLFVKDVIYNVYIYMSVYTTYTQRTIINFPFKLKGV